MRLERPTLDERFDELWALSYIEDLSPAATEVCVEVLELVAEEEAPDGLFATLASDAPHLIPRLEAMQRDHRELRVLAHKAFRFASLDAPVAVQHAALSWLRDELDVHNSRECEAMQEAYLTDLGGEG